ncbi:MAG: hypothetical protein AAB284_01135, partial [Chloroflexota bacterium]
MLARLPHRQGDRGLEHGHVDELSAAVALASRERGEDRDRPVERSGEVGDRHSHLDRRPAFRAGDAHEARDGLHDDVERRPIRVRPGLPPAADRRVDKPVVRLEEGGGGEAEVGHRPGAEVLDDDVGASRQAPEELLPLVGLEVEGEAALVAVEPDELAALAVEHGREAPRQVAGAGLFDLDAVGAEVGELH